MRFRIADGRWKTIRMCGVKTGLPWETPVRLFRGAVNMYDSDVTMECPRCGCRSDVADEVLNWIESIEQTPENELQELVIKDEHLFLPYLTAVGQHTSPDEATAALGRNEGFMARLRQAQWRPLQSRRLIAKSAPIQETCPECESCFRITPWFVDNRD